MQIRSYIKSLLIGLGIFGGIFVPLASADVIYNTGNHVFVSSSTTNVKKITVTNVNTAVVNISVNSHVNSGHNSQNRNIGGDFNIWTGPAEIWTNIHIFTNFTRTIIGW